MQYLKHESRELEKRENEVILGSITMQQQAHLKIA